MRQIKQTLIFTVALLGCSIGTAATAGVLDKLVGTWDTVPIYRGGCEGDAYFHTIEVSPDKQRLTFKHLKPIQGPDGPIQQYTYKVLYEDEDRVTLFLEGETRKNPSGDLLIWVFILERPDYYRWRIYGTPADARNTVTGMRCKV